MMRDNRKKLFYPSKTLINRYAKSKLNHTFYGSLYMTNNGNITADKRSVVDERKFIKPIIDTTLSIEQIALIKGTIVKKYPKMDLFLIRDGIEENGEKNILIVIKDNKNFDKKIVYAPYRVVTSQPVAYLEIIYKRTKIRMIMKKIKDIKRKR